MSIVKTYQEDRGSCILLYRFHLCNRNSEYACALGEIAKK